MHQKVEISLFHMFLIYFKIGFVAFGPTAMVETKKNIVKKLGWISEKELLEGLAVAQLLPGATFVSLTVYIGYKLKGLLGALCSFVGFILPSFFFMTILSWLYFKYQSIAFTNIMFKGLEAIVVALILNAVIDLAKTSITNVRFFFIAAVSFLVSIYYNNVFLLLAFATLMGILLNLKNEEIPRIINETKMKTIKWKDIINTSIAVIIFFIIVSYDKNLSNLAEVFFKTGALVFGNGYTMLPIIQNEAINIHHWINLNQFMVGVALGQMTPGPIIITATFIGYKVMGILGAVVSTIAIFLPSFLLVVITFQIFERIKNNKYVNSALNGLIATFVGLMMLVVINTARHALVDVLTSALFLSALAVLRFTKLDTKWVILIGIGLYLVIYYSQFIFHFLP
ncbi:chromate efflux transporter [Thermoanaerobacter ethanolicus]|uniref:chromate efflux transporter n=1 Tax=Thermoanaerobacter ethanolicus TaxID=1757 RepID=UPI00296FA847